MLDREVRAGQSQSKSASPLYYIIWIRSQPHRPTSNFKFPPKPPTMSAWVFVPTLSGHPLPFLPFGNSSCVGTLRSAIWQLMKVDLERRGIISSQLSLRNLVSDLRISGLLNLKLTVHRFIQFLWNHGIPSTKGSITVRANIGGWCHCMKTQCPLAGVRWIPSTSTFILIQVSVPPPTVVIF